MTEPINLNKARKAQAKTRKQRQADANAARFGRTKAEKARDEAQARRANTHLDAHQRDDS